MVLSNETLIFSLAFFHSCLCPPSCVPSPFLASGVNVSLQGLNPVERAPAQSPEERENQLIALAIDLAEKQLAEGTASSQVITHYLKLGTTMARLEKQKLENENKLILAKTEALETARHADELYAEAIAAMRSYQGNEVTQSEQH